jgi:hypothetical protein
MSYSGGPPLHNVRWTCTHRIPEPCPTRSTGATYREVRSVPKHGSLPRLFIHLLIFIQLGLRCSGSPPILLMFAFPTLTSRLHTGRPLTPKHLGRLLSRRALPLRRADPRGCKCPNCFWCLVFQCSDLHASHTTSQLVPIRRSPVH